ncbi:SigE family RNA polymerase sigma factor [Dactylosporangium sp. NPDC051541]|uniref:SigE family RNA polymerase sigma factor n=1 Tax=Dactylosporangium sp. NPDC051541 TaxID=3363977 RepID=UPI003797775E
MRAELEHDYVEYVRSRLPRLHRVAYLVLGDADAADDAVQNALTVLYRRWPRIAEVEHLDAYVHTMVVRACLADRRRPWSRVVLVDRPPETGAGDHGRRVDDALLVRQALHRLPERQRIVVTLRYLCDLPVAEVAQILGLAEGTIKSRTAYALQALRQVIEGPAAVPKGSLP